MLSFSDFKTRLALSQLKNTHAVDQDIALDAIIDTQEDTILRLTNEGLLDISTKMQLFTKQLDLVFVTDQLIYPITPSGVDVYLFEEYTDTFDEDDFLKIIEVFDSDGKRHHPDTNGHFITPSYNVLRFTAAKIEELGERIRIRYQARHPIITNADNINLPPNLETALQLFVAGLFQAQMNGEEHIKKGNSYYGAYLKHLGLDEANNNSSTSEIDEVDKFTIRGFV